MSIEDNKNSTTICICDENGVHYPCYICGTYHDDEIDALLCCLGNNSTSQQNMSHLT